MNTLRYAKEGLHMYKRHRAVNKKGFTGLEGDAQSIIKKELKQLWNGKYLQTDQGNYPQFYSRDFGMVLPALLSSGMKDKAKKTLAYALQIYEKAGKITSHITANNKVVNFPPAYSIDSIAYILRSVRILNEKPLLKKHSLFLQQEIEKFAEKALDGQGKIKRGKHFTGMRDHAIRDASCYDTVMAAIVQREAKKLGLDYKYSFVKYKQILIEDYWNGKYFDNDMRDHTFTSDANIMPFWHEIITDEEKLKLVIKHIQKKHLDKPFPLKYVGREHEQGKTIIFNVFSKEWQSSSIWPMIGLPFIDLVLQVDKKMGTFYHKQYSSLIEKYGTFIEVYNKKGKPYSSSFFSSSESMIWSAIWLNQKKKIE